MSDNIIPLRRTAQPEPTLRSDNIRGVAPIPAEHLRAIFEPKPVHIELHRYRSLSDRIADALASEFAFAFFCGGVCGALFTVAAAWLIAFSGGVR